MGVRPVISKDAKMITVQVEYGVTTVVRPIPHVKTKAGLIHEPEVKKFKGRLTQTVASEGSFIILGFPHSGTKRPRQLAILVAARVIKAKPPGK